MRCAGPVTTITCVFRGKSLFGNSLHTAKLPLVRSRFDWFTSLVPSPHLTIMSIKRGPSSQNEDTIIHKRPRAILPQDVNIPEGIDHAIMDETVLNTLDPRTELPKEEGLSENDLTALLSTIILVERASNGSSPKLRLSRNTQ